MARSITTIENEILTEKSNNRRALDPLTSNSGASLWRQFIGVISIAIYQFEVILDSFLRELTDRANSSTAASIRWLSYICTGKFQYDVGTPQVLLWNETTYQLYYPIVDESLRIVTKASASVDETSNIITIKVAKGTSGNLTSLSLTELSALDSFIEQSKAAGQKTNVISLAADNLYIVGQVYIDGQYSTTQVFDNIKVALNEYLLSVDFDSLIYFQKIEASILSVDGVIDLKTDLMAVRDATSSPFGFTAYNRIITSQPLHAGYAKLETESVFDLDNNLDIIVV